MSYPCNLTILLGVSRKDRLRLSNILPAVQSSGHYDYRPKGDPSSYLVSRPVPWIQLKGQWLAHAGFIIAAKLKVRVMKGCLVVTMEREDK